MGGPATGDELVPREHCTSLLYLAVVLLTSVMSNFWLPLTLSWSEAFRSTEGDLCVPLLVSLWAAQLCLASLGTDTSGTPETRSQILIFSGKFYCLDLWIQDRNRCRNVHLCISPSPRSWVPLHLLCSLSSQYLPYFLVSHDFSVSIT